MLCGCYHSCTKATCKAHVNIIYISCKYNFLSNNFPISNIYHIISQQETRTKEQSPGQHLQIQRAQSAHTKNFKALMLPLPWHEWKGESIIRNLSVIPPHLLCILANLHNTEQIQGNAYLSTFGSSTCCHWNPIKYSAAELAKSNIQLIFPWSEHWCAKFMILGAKTCSKATLNILLRQTVKRAVCKPAII